MNPIYLNGFSLEILTNIGSVKKLIYKNASYFSLPINSEYKIRVGNDRSVRVDVHIWINNNKIGIWRINPYSNIVIEKPSGNNNKFMLTNLQSSDSIKIIFNPEKFTYPQTNNSQNDKVILSNINKPSICKSYTDTVTPYGKLHRNCALSDEDYSKYISFNLSPPLNTAHSSVQTSEKLDPIQNIDESNVTIIYTSISPINI
jgi:hypothetical protein